MIFPCKCQCISHCHPGNHQPMTPQMLLTFSQFWHPCFLFYKVSIPTHTLIMMIQPTPTKATPFLMTVLDRGSLRSHLWRLLDRSSPRCTHVYSHCAGDIPIAVHQRHENSNTYFWGSAYPSPSSSAWKNNNIHPPPAMPGISSCAAWCPCRSAQACTKGTNMATSGPLLNIAEAAATGAVTRSCAMRKEVFWWPRSRNLGFGAGVGFWRVWYMILYTHTHIYNIYIYYIIYIYIYYIYYIILYIYILYTYYIIYILYYIYTLSWSKTIMI